MRVTTAVTCFPLYGGCGFISRDEALTVTSADNNFDAGVIEANGSVTTSITCDVYVASKEPAPGAAKHAAGCYAAVRTHTAAMCGGKTERLTIRQLLACLSHNVTNSLTVVAPLLRRARERAMVTI